MFGKEPVIIAAAIAAIIQGILIFGTGDLNAAITGWEIWLTPIVTMIAGLFGRQNVVPNKTIKEAGISPSSIKDSSKMPTRRL